MYRVLPGVILVVLIGGVVALATAGAFESDAQPAKTARLAPTPIQPNCDVIPEACSNVPARTPILCPAPNCEVWPPSTPPPGGDPTPKPEPFVVNGVEIPIPPGAGSSPPSTSHSIADWVFATPMRESQIAFTREGWIVGVDIAPEDASDFRPALDALHLAADPVSINGVSFRIPWGAVYHTPFFAPWNDAYIGPPEEAPELHYVKRGDSIISWDIDGVLVFERVTAADAADFAQILAAFGR